MHKTKGQVSILLFWNIWKYLSVSVNSQLHYTLMPGQWEYYSQHQKDTSGNAGTLLFLLSVIYFISYFTTPQTLYTWPPVIMISFMSSLFSFCCLHVLDAQCCTSLFKYEYIIIFPVKCVQFLALVLVTIFLSTSS